MVYVLHPLKLVLAHILLQWGRTDDVMGSLISLFCPTWHTILKTLTRFFGLSKKRSLKKFNRSYLQERKGEMSTNRALSDLKTPKLKEILIKAVFTSHQNETITVLKTLIQ